jgi:hypothetical protein
MGQGIIDMFFHHTENPIPPYLDHQNPFYAPKLAAAVRVWMAVALDGWDGKKHSSPKQKIETWLRDHAHQVGLTKPDGSENEEGINEVAKVANWGAKGGAPKTNLSESCIHKTLNAGFIKLEKANFPLSAPTEVFDGDIPF